MAGPTGLIPFAEQFPNRFFDVGIAEQHAMASASGLALGGLHPVVAIYSTFLNRAFDQLLMDIALLKQPVTIVLDRAGVTGSDGASHNGVWDMALTTIIPGIHVDAPRDGQRLRELFQESLEIKSGPSVVRFPKGNLLEDMDAVATTEDGVDIIFESEQERFADAEAKKVLVISIGAMAARSLGAAQILEDKGMAVTVVDPRWLCPVAPSLIEMADEHDIVVVAEDGMMRAGVGSLFDEAFSAAEVDTPLRRVAFPSIFPKHGSRGEVLEEVGMDADGIAAAVTEWVDNLH